MRVGGIQTHFQPLEFAPLVDQQSLLACIKPPSAHTTCEQHTPINTPLRCQLHIPLFLHHTSKRLLNTCEQPDTIVQTIKRRIISLRPLLQLGMSVTIRHIGEIALVILPSFQSLIQQ